VNGCVLTFITGLHGCLKSSKLLDRKEVLVMEPKVPANDSEQFESSPTVCVVSAGISIFIQNELAHQSRYILLNSCSNIQAEQLAIVKALEAIGKLHINDTIPRFATVHTDSRITLQSLQNANNHKYLIEEIRKSAITLGKSNWTIKFTWIKVYVGIYGNELADKLVTEASRKDEISFKRIPEVEIIHQLKEQSIANWQNQWDSTTKGQATK